MAPVRRESEVTIKDILEKEIGAAEVRRLSPEVRRIIKMLDSLPSPGPVTLKRLQEALR